MLRPLCQTSIQHFYTHHNIQPAQARHSTMKASTVAASVLTLLPTVVSTENPDTASAKGSCNVKLSLNGLIWSHYPPDGCRKHDFGPWLSVEEGRSAAVYFSRRGETPSEHTEMVSRLPLAVFGGPWKGKLICSASSKVLAPLSRSDYRSNGTIASPSG